MTTCVARLGAVVSGKPWRMRGRAGGGFARRLRWAVSLVLLVCIGCESAPSQRDGYEEDPELHALEPILPVPLDEDLDERLVQVGETLFHSTIVSDDRLVACSHCHDKSHGMADRTRYSTAPGREPTLTNSPPLNNLRYLYRLNWNGKFETLEEHIDALIENPKVIGSTWARIAERLNREPEWVARFIAATGQRPTPKSTRAALIEYERSLVSPDAPFDRWLRGDKQALSSEALRGYVEFKRYGCITCHQGVGVGGNMFQRFGVMKAASQQVLIQNEADLGRFNLTRLEADRFVFRVPSLRNVALTAPYFHDGSGATLEQAIDTMADVQLGLRLPRSTNRAIVAFLDSLTSKPKESTP
jgi:cytochrome c peroxidase